MNNLLLDLALFILNLAQERSVATDEFVKRVEDVKTPTEHASEAKISDIARGPPQIATSGSNDDIHDINSMDGGPDNDSASQTDDSIKQSDTSPQAEPTSFGRCIGKFFDQTNNI